MIANPRLVFRVGISGHRPDRLAAAGADETLLRSQIRKALLLVAETVQQVQQDHTVPYAAGKPILRVISSLAEGADRLSASVACELGFELDVPLPFAQAVYENDFVSKGREAPRDSRPEFRELLGQSRRVLELDSVPNTATAYVAVGTTTVRQCDLLLAIWDGGEARGPGGTPDNVSEALRIELPTIWIDARGAGKHAMGLAAVRGGQIVQQPWDATEVAARIRRVISLPAPSDQARTDAHRQSTSALKCAQDFFDEQPNQASPRSFFAIANRFFARGWRNDSEYQELQEHSDVVAPLSANDRVPLEPHDEPLARELKDTVPARDWTPEFRMLLNAIGASLAPAFRDADLLAIRFANLHRDYMAMGFLLYAPLAVLCAFLGYALRDHTVVTISFGVAEVALIGAIWWGHRRNVRGRYHERWLDYRSIAEKLRHVLILAPLGRPSLNVQFPLSLGASNPASHWTNWYLRARIGEEGLVSGRLHDPKYATALRALLWRWLVRGQVRYHAQTAARMRTALRSVQAWRNFFFVAAAAAAVMHVMIAAVPAIHDWETTHEWLAMALSAATVFFPAVVAALHGYSHQADFENTELRSQRELQRLLQVDGELRARPEPSGLDLLRATSLTSESMLAELAEWRQDTASRPAEKP